jgi:hypothetical protein
MFMLILAASLTGQVLVKGAADKGDIVVLVGNDSAGPDVYGWSEPRFAGAQPDRKIANGTLAVMAFKNNAIGGWYYYTVVFAKSAETFTFRGEKFWRVTDLKRAKEVYGDVAETSKGSTPEIQQAKKKVADALKTLDNARAKIAKTRSYHQGKLSFKAAQRAQNQIDALERAVLNARKAVFQIIARYYAVDFRQLQVIAIAGDHNNWPIP